MLKIRIYYFLTSLSSGIATNLREGDMRLEIPYGNGFLHLDTGMMNSIEPLIAKKAVSPPDLETRLFNEIESSGVLRKN